MERIKMLLVFQVRYNMSLFAQSDGKAEFSFEDLLTFITGADRLPPLGFPRFISLCFYSQVGV